MRQIYLSIIIPSYNEKENIKRGVLSQINNFMKKKDFGWEVIVSDDGSTDGSNKLVKKIIRKWKNFSLLQNPHGGKPFVLKKGLDVARGRFVLFTDMDQSTPIEELDKLLPVLEEGSKAAIGSRGMGRKNFPFYRRLGSVVFMSLRKLFLLPEINDTQCGFKVFDRNLVKKAFPKLQFFKQSGKARGWTVTSYDVELLYIIKKMDIPIREVRVNWEERDISVSKGGSLSRYTRQSKEMLSEIVRVKLNDLRGLYD